MEKLVNREGWAFVMDEMPRFSEPVMVRSFWPLGIRAHDIEYNYGRTFPIELEYRGNGIYIEISDAYRPLQFRLKDGGQTKPEFCEKEPIFPPKTKKPTRWMCGRWEKLLKSGWVRI